MPQRTPPKPSSGCSTSRADGDLRGAAFGCQQGRPAGYAGVSTEFEPSNGVGSTDGPDRRRRPAGVETLERFPTEGCGQTSPGLQRGEVAPDKLDLSGECRFHPQSRHPLRVTQRATKPKRVQRQHPVGRWRWGGNRATARREEDLERGRMTDRRPVAGPRHRGLVGSGRANDHRHVATMGPPDQRALIAASTLRGSALRWDDGRRTPRHEPCG
jgi:hypothetical protein